jgi:protoporphyrinogen oxidase
MNLKKYTILGAGLSSISASYHLGHNNCILFERNNYVGGHIYSEKINDFIWDEGPHVSFTKNEYVKNLFANNIKGDFLQYPVDPMNYYKGSWIPHPAQSNLWAVPSPLNKNCLFDFISTRENQNKVCLNYYDWLKLSFGELFTDVFSVSYTKKYWTVHPMELTTDWVGERIFRPDIEDVKNGFIAPLDKKTHYITEVRYPKIGGYFGFAEKMYTGANISLNKELLFIDFNTKKLSFKDGSIFNYDYLINTIPLPILIERSSAPDYIKEAANELNCTSVLLINICISHPALRSNNWIYVYDENKFSTRINYTELLSPNNAPKGKSGIQVEVYFSRHKSKEMDDEEIAKVVSGELIEMGLIKGLEYIESCHTRWVKWANIIFDHKRKEAQKVVFDFLEKYGLIREEDELDPMTDWEKKKPFKMGKIVLAGRYAQWKYYWTDDCILRGKLIADSSKW